MGVDVPRVRAAVRELLAGIGEDPEREGLRDTPRRVASMFEEVLSGLDEDPHDPSHLPSPELPLNWIKVAVKDEL